MLLAKALFIFAMPPLLLESGMSRSGLNGADGMVDILAQRESQKSGQADMKRNEKETPFACNISGLTDSQRVRWMALLEKLRSLNEGVNELPDGYAFRFPADPLIVQEVAEFIIYERLCCPFFDLELALEREGGPLWLRLRGREGVKEFIRAEFGL